MEQMNDLKMKNVISENVDENQNENMEVTNDVVNEIENENIVVDEEALPDAFNGDYDDDSSSDDSDTSDLDDGLNDYDDLPSNQRNLYKILSMADIQDCMRKDVLNVSEILSISKAEAVVLLLHCCWNVEIVTESWFANSEEFREELGLFKIPAAGLGSPSTKDMTCGKCSQTIPEQPKFDAFCSHKFCNTCWKDFIGTCLEDPRLMLECPDESCNAAVNQEMIIRLASEAGQNLYLGIFLRSYLDDNSSKGKWCPIPGCNHAVFPESANSVSTFTCKCLFTFCYKCLKEAHAPLSCVTAERWRKEQLYQSKNRHLAYTRKCLKCEWPVAVKAWLKHMECPACHFQFCRECNSSWLEHGHWEGDHHTHICPQAKLKAMVEDENKRAKARNDYGRYQECLSLWNAQNMEQNQVLMKLRLMQNEELKAVAENQALPLEELSFVTDAWLQAVECKRVFKYTCVSNFYFHIVQEKPLCNDLIKNGAFVLEQLCLVAAELRMLVRKTVPAQQFEDFRKRLCLKTSVARNYFQNMEIAIKNEYTDIKTIRLVICSRESIERKTDSTEELKEWTCSHCSFSNDGSTTVCVMCYH